MLIFVLGVEDCPRAYDALAQDLEFHVADQWDAAPCYGDGP